MAEPNRGWVDEETLRRLRTVADLHSCPNGHSWSDSIKRGECPACRDTRLERWETSSGSPLRLVLDKHGRRVEPVALMWRDAHRP